MDKKFCIDTEDKELGKRVVFDEKNRKNHAKKRQELNDPKFIAKVKKTIEDPQHIYESLNDPKRVHVYYRLERYQDTRWGRTNVFTAVVILVAYTPYKVKTAFSTDRIREEDQTKCLSQRDP